MITNTTDLGNSKEYDVTCDKCSAVIKRSVSKELDGKLLSNTEGTLCDACKTSFEGWLKTKGYIDTDCWCKRLPEYLLI